MEWHRLEKDQTQAMIETVQSDGMPGLFSPVTSHASRSKLPFYTGFLLHRLTNFATLPAFSMDFLSDGNTFLYLDGTPDPIYRVNDTGDLILNENTVLDYMAFFVHYVPGPEGEMLLIDSSHKAPPLGSLDIDKHRAMLYTHRDLDLSFDDVSGVYTVKIPMYYGGALVKATIEITSRGRLDIKDYKMILRDSFSSELAG